MAKEKVDPKKHAALAFAKMVAQRIVTAMRSGQCDEVALISAPRFLGVLREALSKAGGVVPALSIDKEMVGKNAAAIEKLLDTRS